MTQWGESTRTERFEALTLPFAPAVYRAAYFLARSSGEAEDLTQETYLKAYRAFDQWREQDPKPWLFAILRHAFLDCCRRQEREPSAEDRVIATYLGPSRWPR